MDFERIMKVKGKMSLSSRLWLNRQMHDPYVKRAHKEGYRSRAAYKLLEIDEKFKLIKESKYIIDLGAAPGGWSQLLAQKSSEDAKIVAIDLLNFDELPKVQQFIGDFEDKANQQKIIEALGQKADLIVSDMAPATVGHAQTDHLRIMNLVTSAYDFALNTLAPGGSFVAKIFMGGKEKQFFERVKKDFAKAYFFKPKSSRSVSVEIYVVGRKFLPLRGECQRDAGPGNSRKYSYTTVHGEITKADLDIESRNLHGKDSLKCS